MGRGSSGAGTRSKGARASRGSGAGGGGGGPAGASGGGRPGESKARVTFDPDITAAQRKKLFADFQKIAGPQTKLQDVASLVGAPANSQVTLLGQYSGTSTTTRFDISVQGPGIKANRSIFRDKLGRLTIRNVSIELKTTGTGEGSRILANQAAFASQFGVKSIKADASRNMGLNGYYTWARLGYNAKLTPAIRGALPAELKGSRSMHELMRTQSGRDWWLANGTSIDMRFNLAPGSRAMKNLKAYIAERGL